MLTAAGTTWTTKDETLEIYEAILMARLADTPEEKRKLVGERTVPPECDKSNGGCGATTCYIVLNDPKITPPPTTAHAVIGLCQIPFYKFDGSIYLPVRLCNKCSASHQGYRDGLHRPFDKEISLDLSKAPLTEEEKETYKTIYLRAFAKGEKRRADLREAHQKKKDKSRYAMR